jgi:hypothetical protein
MIMVQASNQLKTEGNQLHSRGAYKEAVEKYERAKSNVESFTSKEARDLVRACNLNLSSCYLNLKQYSYCLEQCNSVLSGEASWPLGANRTGTPRQSWNAGGPWHGAR